MIRTILTSTALVALVASPVMAADTPKPAAKTEAPMEQGVGNANHSEVYLLEVMSLKNEQKMGFLASNLMGENVFTAGANGDESIGEVSDLILDQNGEATMAIIGVGGFLGIAEKDVAVDFDRLQMKSTDKNQFRITTDLTRSELENAEAFQRPDYLPRWMSEAYIADKFTAAQQSTSESFEQVGDTIADMGSETMKSDWLTDKTLVASDSLTADRVLGAPVFGRTFETMGEVGDVEVSTDGKVDAVVVNVGGFLGLGEKPVALPFKDLSLYEDESGALVVMVPHSQKELENAPTYEPAKYKADPSSVLVK